jgi:predicted esterase
MIERNIATTTHGRYLVNADAGRGAPLLVGFHGYAESAEDEYQRLSALPGGERWLRVAVQGLHRFYRRRPPGVVASWMTSQDRDLAIADNRAYVAQVIDSVVAEWVASPVLVVSGFSQGVAMAYRTAVHCGRPVRGVVANGGDIPPELDQAALAKIPAVVLGRGQTDEWYTEEKLAADERRLRKAGVNTKIVRFDGGHEWPPDFSRAVGEFLSGRWS